MKNQILLFVLCSFLFQSCSFNRFFYFTSAAQANMEGINHVELDIRNKKNKKIHTVLLNPETESPKAFILFLHGNGGNNSTWIKRVEPFSRHGYKVLIFDYQGFGQSEGKPSHKNLLEDSQLVLDYVVEQCKKEKLKIILMGYSMGGNLAVELARRNHGLVDALVVEGAFSSHKKIALRFVPGGIKPIAKLLVKEPYSSCESIKEVNGIPKLIIHSYEDQVCPMEMGEEIYANATEPKEYWQIMGEHCRGIFYYEKDYLAKLDRLLNSDKSLRPEPNFSRQ